MADYLPQLGDLPSKIASSKRVLVALPKDFSIDSLGSALALALALQKAGKTVSVVSEGNPLVSHSHLYGIGDVKNEVPSSGEGNYVIKLDGVVDPSGQMNTVPALEKLDWYPEGSALNLVFHVVPGQRFEPTNVSYAHETSGFDLIFTVDADSLDELGQIYLKNAALFSKSTVVNIDNDPSNSQFGNVNVVDSQASSISEMMISVLKSLSLEMDSDIASNLVAGIYAATVNLTQKVSPETFSAVSQAMQLGGKLPEGGMAQSEQLAVSSEQKESGDTQNEIRNTENTVQSQPVPEAVQPETQPVNQIQFGSNQSSVVSPQTSVTQPIATEPTVQPQTPVQPVSLPVEPQPVQSTEPVSQPQPVSTQPVSGQAAPAPQNDLYSNPFLNPTGQAFSGGPFNSQPADQPVVNSQPPASSAPQDQSSVFGAPAAGPTFNFGSFGDSANQPTANSQQPAVNSAPQEPVVDSASVQPDPVDLSGPLSTIMQAKQKDDAYDLKQIFNVEQMPETPTSANTTLDSAVQRAQATIDGQQPSQAQAVRDQQSAGQTQSAPSSQPQPVQASKPQSSPEEKPAGEAVTSTNPEAEANPTPDWLVPKIFKGGSLG